MNLALNTKHLSSFINEEEYKAIYPQVEAAHKTLEAKNGPGSDFLGWMYLPRDYDKEEFERIKAAAAKIREDSDVLVVAGIGGSYLGARAVIEAVKGMYHNELDNGLKIYFCGNSISPTYLNDIIALCKGKRFSINVISKSGTTTETSLAFRVLRKLLEDEMGVEEANKRIYATTDRAKGTLKQLADAQGWPTFVVPDDVGASLESLGGLRATGEHEDLGGLTGAVRQVDGTADQLVGLARIHVQAQHGLNGLIELVFRHALDESDGFVGGVKVVAIDLFSRFAILLGTLYHLSLSSQSVTVIPIERAVPSMIFMPASTSRADRSAILISAISRT